MSKKLSELETALHSLADQSPVPLARVLGKLGMAVGSNGRQFGNEDTRRRVMRSLEELPKTGRWLIYTFNKSDIPQAATNDDQDDTVWVSFRHKKPGCLM